MPRKTQNDPEEIDQLVENEMPESVKDWVKQVEVKTSSFNGTAKAKQALVRPTGNQIVDLACPKCNETLWIVPSVIRQTIVGVEIDAPPSVLPLNQQPSLYVCVNCGFKITKAEAKEMANKELKAKQK